MEPFSIAKALSLTPTAVGKSMSVLAKALIGFAVLFTIGVGIWSLYCTIVRPTTKPIQTTTQNADAIQNIYIQPKQTFFGCTDFRLLKQAKETPINATK